MTLGLCRAWSKFFLDVHKWSDACKGVEAEWHEVQKFVLTHDLLKINMKKCFALDFLSPIVKAWQKFPCLHVILRCALALPHAPAK